MAISYRDFFPQTVTKSFFGDKHESLSATVVRANDWIASDNIKVLNVETVVLPNVRNEAAASEVGVRTSGEMSSWWYQVVRVWYEVPDPPAQA